MIWEMIILGLLSVSTSIITLLLMQRNWIMRQQILHSYDLELIKLKKREGRKDKKLAATLPDKHKRGAIDSLRSLDLEKVGGILDFLSKDDEEDNSGILDVVGRVVNENPDLVQGLIDGFGGGKKKREHEEAPGIDFE